MQLGMAKRHDPLRATQAGSPRDCPHKNTNIKLKKIVLSSQVDPPQNSELAGWPTKKNIRKSKKKKTFYVKEGKKLMLWAGSQVNGLR